MKKDPFSINGAAEYQFIEFSPMNMMSDFHVLSEKINSVTF